MLFFLTFSELTILTIKLNKTREHIHHLGLRHCGNRIWFKWIIYRSDAIKEERKKSTLSLVWYNRYMITTANASRDLKYTRNVYATTTSMEGQWKKIKVYG